MANDELLSKTISFLRFPLTVGVVFIHFNIAKSGFIMQGVRYGLDNPNWYYYIIYFFSDVLPRVAVPLFFIISGFLFFYHKDFNKSVYLEKLKTRTATLLVPFVLWNIIAILIVSFRMIPSLSSVFPMASKIEFHFSLERLFNTFFANDESAGLFITPNSDVLDDGNIYPIDVPLWYVRDLMVMILFTPVLYWLIRRLGMWFVMVMGLSWFLMKPIILPNGGWLAQLCMATFFFSWGAYYSINKQSFVEQMRRMRFVPLFYFVFIVGDTLTKDANYNIFIHNAGIIVGIVTAVIITSYLVETRKSKVCTTLANSSFFVFALHTLILGDIGKVLFKCLHLSDNTYAMLLLYFVTPIVTCCFCVGLYVFLKRYVPVVANLLTGNR